MTYKTSAMWFKLGLVLRVEENQLTAISADNTGNSDLCLMKMLTHLLHTNPGLTWEDLCSALRHDVVKRTDLATEIERKYLPSEYTIHVYPQPACTV